MMKVASRLAALAFVMFLSASLLTHGCSTGSTAGLEQSRSSFQSGDFGAAYESSRAIATDTAQPVAQRQQAAYFAGVSALKLGKTDEARDLLQQASESTDPGLSGDALAQLGLLYTQTGQYNLASSSLLRASEKMSGQDKANALFYAGVAQQRMGQFPQARTNLLQAQGISSDPAFKRKVAEQLSVTGYTIQVGAFTSEANAKRMADQVTPKAAPLKHTTRVVPSIDPTSNQKIYLVQVGSFISQPTAMMARDSLRLDNALVVPMREPR